MEVNFINSVKPSTIASFEACTNQNVYIHAIFGWRSIILSVGCLASVSIILWIGYEVKSTLKDSFIIFTSFPHSFLELSRWIYTMHLCSAYSYLKSKAFQVYVSCSCSLFLFKKDNSILKEKEKRVKPHFRRNKTSNYWQYESDDKAINYQQFFLLVSYTHT